MAQGLIDAETKKILLREALLAIRDFSGAGGNISFSTEGSWRMPLEVFQVRGGKLMRGQPLKAGK
jgi:hypothetical protein